MADEYFNPGKDFLKDKFLAKDPELYLPLGSPPTTYASPRPPPTTYASPAPAKPTGGKLSGKHYYQVPVTSPINPELPPYTAECADIIEALGMTFNEGEAFKAIWRGAAARQGRGKPGNDAQYDADKAAHYGARIAAQVRRNG